MPQKYEIPPLMPSLGGSYGKIIPSYFRFNDAINFSKSEYLLCTDPPLY
jgi:hypothetical protein